jgi:hypothetical protein
MRTIQAGELPPAIVGIHIRRSRFEIGDFTSPTGLEHPLQSSLTGILQNDVPNWAIGCCELLE